MTGSLLDRRWLVLLVFYVLPALAYAGIISDFSFNPFAPAYGWQAYNHYALALAGGGQAVPAEAISGEGLYIGGRVYMYYGVFSALLRFALMPFVDLTVTPVSNLLVWGMVVGGQVPLQAALLAVVRARLQPGGRDAAFAALASCALWFGSGAFLVAQNANLYHEPYAAATLLSSLFIAALARDVLVARRRPGVGRLAAYALLAGLAVFTRQTYAVGLYLATLLLMLPIWRELMSRPLAVVGMTVLRATPALAILFVCGAAYLALNYARVGELGGGWTVRDYGFYIIGLNRPRLITMIDQQFSVVRILPNVIYGMIGGTALREGLIARAGGGLVETFGAPVRQLIFAPVLLVFAAAGLVALYRRVRTAGLLAPELLVTFGLLATSLLQLAYGTMNYRYNAEQSPMLIWLMLIALRDIDVHRLGRSAIQIASTLAVLSVVSLAYWSTLRVKLLTDHPGGNGSFARPLPPELAARATAPGARDPEIEAVRWRIGGLVCGQDGGMLRQPRNRQGPCDPPDTAQPTEPRRTDAPRNVIPQPRIVASASNRSTDRRQDCVRGYA